MVAPLPPTSSPSGPGEVRLRRRMRHPAPVVWSRLLTEPELWLGPGAVIEGRPGGRVADGERRGVVLDVREPTLLRWEWSADGDPGWSSVELRLDEAGEGCEVTVIERLHSWEFESFPAQDAGGMGGSPVGACRT